MSYLCNCGKEFKTPEERIAHATNCSAVVHKQLTDAKQKRYTECQRSVMEIRQCIDCMLYHRCDTPNKEARFRDKEKEVIHGPTQEEQIVYNEVLYVVAVKNIRIYD